MRPIVITHQPYVVQGYVGHSRLTVRPGEYLAEMIAMQRPDEDDDDVTSCLRLFRRGESDPAYVIIAMDYPDLDDWPAMPPDCPFQDQP